MKEELSELRECARLARSIQVNAKGEALVRGKRVPVAGRVCMDMTMLDVTDVSGVAEGDEVVHHHGHEVPSEGVEDAGALRHLDLGANRA